MQRQMTDRHFGLIHTGVCMDPWGQRTPEWPSECTRLLLAAGGGWSSESFLTGTSSAVTLLTFFLPYGTRHEAWLSAVPPQKEQGDGGRR